MNYGKFIWCNPLPTLCAASFLISSCSLLRMWRFGLFFLAYCCSSITLLSDFSCEWRHTFERWELNEKTNTSDGKFSGDAAPSWPSCCSLCRTCAAASPSSSRGDEASAGSSGRPAACRPACSYLAKRTPTTQQVKLLPGWLLVCVWGDESQLTPAAHSVLPTCHHIFTLLVFPRNHLKFDAGVSHSVVSVKKWKK